MLSKDRGSIPVASTLEFVSEPMHPYLIDIPLPFSDEPFHLRSFGVMVALGFIIGSWILGHLAKRYGDDPENDPERYASVTMWILIGLFIGGRALYVIVEIAGYLSSGDEIANRTGYGFVHDPLSILMVWKGGLVFYGGLTGAVVGGIIRARKLGLRTRHALDMGLTAGCFGQAIGRIGCFLVGCDFGTLVPNNLTHLPFPITVKLPEKLHEASLFATKYEGGEILWATQLWMMANAALLGVFALWLLSRRKWAGQITAWLLVLYPIGRYAVEAFRGDTGRGVWFNETLSTSQLISMVALPFGLFLLWRGHQKYARETVKPEEEIKA